ncbi:MAG: electron transfer flavoprotein subunit alpha/FixB family protein [Planctomycetota bacterium]
MTTILVFVEHQASGVKRAGLEAIGAARAVSDSVIPVLAGPGAAEAAATLAGASVALTGDTMSPDGLATDLAGLVREKGATAFLASATSAGRDVAPRVAALLDSNIFTDCVGLTAEGGEVLVQRPWLAGKIVATLRSKAPVLCATLRRNTFPAADAAGGGQVEQKPLTVGKTVLAGVAAKEGGKLDVSEAPVVVSGGRGLKEAENFNIVEELAAAFGDAATGASRAIVDAGWRPHGEQVGQTGKTVSPQLYIAVGISGAIQHLAGMKTSKVIVAINKDADAPIFKVADYGIVGDAFEVVPALTEAVKQVRAEG